MESNKPRASKQHEQIAKNKVDVGEKNRVSSNSHNSNNNSFIYNENNKAVAMFIYKLASMISDKANANYISWDTNGERIQIYDKDALSANILPKYFSHLQFRSFSRQLLSYGFVVHKQRFTSCHPNSLSFSLSPPPPSSLLLNEIEIENEDDNSPFISPFTPNDYNDITINSTPNNSNSNGSSSNGCYFKIPKRCETTLEYEHQYFKRGAEKLYWKIVKNDVIAASPPKVVTFTPPVDMVTRLEIQKLLSNYRAQKEWNLNGDGVVHIHQLLQSSLQQPPTYNNQNSLSVKEAEIQNNNHSCNHHHHHHHHHHHQAPFSDDLNCNKNVQELVNYSQNPDVSNEDQSTIMRPINDELNMGINNNNNSSNNNKNGNFKKRRYNMNNIKFFPNSKNLPSDISKYHREFKISKNKTMIDLTSIFEIPLFDQDKDGDDEYQGDDTNLSSNVNEHVVDHHSSYDNQNVLTMINFEETNDEVIPSIINIDDNDNEANDQQKIIMFTDQSRSITTKNQIGASLQNNLDQFEISSTQLPNSFYHHHKSSFNDVNGRNTSFADVTFSYDLPNNDNNNYDHNHHHNYDQPKQFHY